jgi:hypothetical protein
MPGGNESSRDNYNLNRQENTNRKWDGKHQVPSIKSQTNSKQQEANSKMP